ncbi:hypothetical protein L486_02647 [Kwoniella mangroviensis CBS 10435]|uniref:Uncharacterized protein n=1 Tax=Kwoniella mangroviensis CBS 10435 TaxID=1331196 RepID=A0A1B9IX19_9TREE|nr:hypothetical protein L486_02647 [Kwoniella mangroviensis CBS 10435]
MINPNLSPPPYSPAPETHISQPQQHVHLCQPDDIPLLPLVNCSPDIDTRAIRSFRRALEDYQRSSCPSNWGRYRHGVRLSSSDTVDNSKLVEWVCWIASLFASAQDQIERMGLAWLDDRKLGSKIDQSLRQPFPN